MKPYVFDVSVVIPTHNRATNLPRTLDALNQQDFCLKNMEVVVVADGCEDNTLSVLADYQVDFSLTVVEKLGLGAANARNSGAKRARGNLLIFLDDDIEVAPGFVSAHVTAHQGQSHGKDKVVIGYLPAITQHQTDFFQIGLRCWWESKFQSMQRASHRFTYQDLLSGNFSIAARLFQEMGGFNTEFLCKEDYEFGLRLILLDVDFEFSPDAWGYHHEVTDFRRSLKRKFNEGVADIQLIQIHPEIKEVLLVTQLESRYTWFDRLVLWFIFYGSAIGDLCIIILCHILKLLEWYRLRDAWQILYRKIHIYWYMRGATSKFGSHRELTNFLDSQLVAGSTKEQKITLDLDTGLDTVGKVLDQQRPMSALLYYKQQYIGYIEPEPGAEALRSGHLKRILHSTFAWQLLSTLCIKNIAQKDLFSLEA